MVFAYQFTAEVYTTKIRTTGIGFANAIGRLGGVIMPWVCIPLMDHNLFSPFLVLAIICLLAALADCFLPFDTTGRDLD